MIKEIEKSLAIDRKSTILLSVFILLVVISVGLSFYKYFILRDYTIQSQVDCDPYSEACFIYRCDSTVEECSGDPVADTWYYKLVDRKAKNLPSCNPEEEGCDVVTCGENENGCFVTLCDMTAEAEGAECSDPAVYSLQNSIEEESEALPAPDSQEVAPSPGMEEQSEAILVEPAQ